MNKSIIIALTVPIVLALFLYFTAPPSEPGEDDFGEKPFEGEYSGTLKGIFTGVLEETIQASYVGGLRGEFSGVITFNGVKGDCGFTIKNGTFTGKIKGTRRGQNFTGEINGRGVNLLINGTVPVAVIDPGGGSPQKPSNLESRQGTYLLIGLSLLIVAIAYYLLNSYVRGETISKSEDEIIEEMRTYLLEKHALRLREVREVWCYPNEFKPTILRFLFTSDKPYFDDHHIIGYSRGHFKGLKKNVSMALARTLLNEYTLVSTPKKVYYAPRSDSRSEAERAPKESGETGAKT